MKMLENVNVLISDLSNCWVHDGEKIAASKHSEILMDSAISN